MTEEAGSPRRRITVHERVPDWSPLVASDNPFLEPAFLSGLERSGAVGVEAGWTGRHLVVEEAGRLVAALPTYLRGDSWGEYVFDHGWANAAHRAGLRYYPKLTSAIPFTPAAPGRVIGEPAAIPALAEAARLLAERVSASGHHVLFVTEAEAETFAAEGYAVRLGLQFHWTDDGYGDFEGFVGRLTSRRRKELLRERRQVREAGVEVRTHRGEELGPTEWAALERFYRQTHAEHGNPGYLPPAWWRDELPRLAPYVVAVLARRNGVPVAGTLNFTKGDALYGRYWGADEEVRGLHFEACYHALVEWALANGVRRVEAGAQGEHKLQRGFLPHLTRSVHRLYHPGLHDAVADFCAREGEAIRAGVAEYAEHSPFAATTPPPPDPRRS